jgi:hypothetical protein
MMKLPIPEIRRAGKLINHTPTDGDLITIYASKKIRIQRNPGNLICQLLMLANTNHWPVYLLVIQLPLAGKVHREQGDH